jgi:4-amino-4-deoxy-L-arabinose transferase-like glycosyltransferase
MIKSKVAITSVLIAFTLYTVLAVWYYPAGGDEGAYHYQALMMARGFIPVLDYYQQHLPWAYIPYAVMIRLFSPAIEAVRLYSAMSMVVVTVLVSLVVTRSYGRGAGFLAFAMMGFNNFWLDNNAEVRWSTTANLGLVLTFWLLCLPGRQRPTRSFLLGLAMGLMVNSRVVLLPIALMVLVLLLLDARSGPQVGGKWRAALAYFAGGVMISLPSLYLFAADPQAFLFNSLLARARMYTGAEQYHDAATWLAWFLLSRISAVYQFFFPQYHNPTSMPAALAIFRLPNLAVLLLPFALIAALVSEYGMRKSFRILAGWVKEDRVLRVAILYVLAIFACYSVADRIFDEYLHHWVPFLIVATLGLFVHGRSALQPGWKRVVVGLALMVPAGLAIGDGILTSAFMIFQRDLPRTTGPVSETLVACWLEQNTPRDSVVMSMDGGVVAIADRWLPRGFEQAVGLPGIFWATPANAEVADRYHVLSYPRLLAQLENGAIPVFVSDLRVVPFDDEIRTVLNKHYRLHAVERDVFTHMPIFEIWIHHDAVSRSYAELAPSSWIEPSYRGVRHTRGLIAAVHALLGDIWRSLAALPGDLRTTFARLGNGPYAERCPRQAAMK